MKTLKRIFRRIVFIPFRLLIVPVLIPIVLYYFFKHRQSTIEELIEFINDCYTIWEMSLEFSFIIITLGIFHIKAIYGDDEIETIDSTSSSS